jgi:nitrite reductase (NADH) small subunit
METANWKNIGPASNIPIRGARRLCLTHAGRPIAVFRTGDDEIFALVDECPHKRGPLSEGIVAGNTVSCPLHNWVIDLTDGQAIAPDAGTAQPLKTRIIDGNIHICLSDLLAYEEVA